MPHRDTNQEEMCLSDSPGEAEEVREILAQWGVEEASIRRLMRKHPQGTSARLEPPVDVRERRRRKHSGVNHFSGWR